MPKQEGQKSKLLTLLRILEQKTDEEHLLNVPQLVQLLEQQGIFHGPGRPRHQVAQLGPLRHIHTGQVQHAYALTMRVEQRRACAAVAAVVIKEVLAPVQPHRLQLSQRCSNGGGAHSRF